MGAVEQGQTYSPGVNKAMVRFTRKLKEKRAALDPPEVPSRMLTLADLPIARPEHDPKTCRVYKCGMCSGLKG